MAEHPEGGEGGTERTLHDGIVAASALLDPAALAKVAVSEVRRVLGVEGASITFWDADQQLLLPLAFNDPHVGDPYPVYHPGQGLIGEAFVRKGPVIANDYLRDLEHPPAWSTVVSGIGVPLFADGRLVGSISGQAYHPRTFTSADAELLEMVAAQVGPALSTMRTLARAQREAAEAFALAALMRHGTALDDIDEVFSLVSETAVRLLGADVAGLILGDRQRRGLVWRGVVGNRTDAWRDPRYAHTHPNGIRIFSGETLIHHPKDGPLNPDQYPFFVAEGIRVAIALPLDRTEGPRGALCLGWRFDAHLAPGRREVAEALAAFSGTLVASATARAERDAIVAGAPVIFVALLPDGTVTMCEGAAAVAMGVGPDAVGRNISDLVPDQPALQNAVDEAVAGSVAGPFQIEVGAHTLDVKVELRDGGIFMVGTDVTERRHAEQELYRRAVEDDLTSLPNLSEVLRRIAEVISDEPVCGVLADIRSFDYVNEAIGYTAADELLRQLGTRLADDLKDAIVVGRTGGDEFAVAARGEDVETLARRVRASLEAFVGVGAEAMAVDVRCGLATLTAGGDADMLLRHADSALQVARRGPRTMVRWDAEEARNRLPQHAVTQQLRRVIDDRAFNVAYQPIVDTLTAEVRRVEALARWPSGYGEMVTPDVFVPLAERLGRVHQLTEHVLDVALGEVAAVHSLPVSVNISALDLVHGELDQMISGRLQAHGLDPSCLMLELTEHAALEAGESGLIAIAAMGIALSIDDFGQGWSSFETLKRIKAHCLKLDRAYVARAPHDPTDAAIVRAAVTVGHALGMEVVAEGVEDESVLETVRLFGCTLAQGFHIARPMDAQQLAVWLQKHRSLSRSR